MEGKQNIILKIVTTIIVIVFIVAALIFVPGNDSSMVFAQPDYIGKGFNKNEVNQVDIEIAKEDFDWLIENAMKEEYRSCNITINGETFYNVAIRPKGNSSLNMVAASKDSSNKRYSFKINFGKYVDGQTYHGLEEMALNNVMSDKSYMKEYLSYELYDYMGVPAPVFAYSNIKINDKNWGLYLAVEIVDQSFVKRNFGTVEGNLYKPESMDMGGGFQQGFPGGENQKGFQRGGVQQGFPGGEDQKGFPEGGNEKGIPGGENQKGFSQEGISNENQGKISNQQNPQEGQIPKGQVPQEIEMSKGESNSQQELPNQRAQRNGMPGGFRGMVARGGSNLKYIDDSPESYNVIREGAVFETTTDEEFKKVIDMIKNLNKGTDLEKYLDVDEMLRFWAVNTFLVNLDGYAGGMYHNYYLYEKDGRFTLIPWDLNMSFAGFGINDSASVINFPIDVPVTGSLEDAPLIGKLLEVPQYKEKYHEYLYKIAQVYVGNGLYEKSISSIDKIISDFVKNDASAFYTFEDYEQAIPQMLIFGKDRSKSILEQLNGIQPSDTYGNIQTELNTSYLGSMGGNFGGNRNAEGNNRGKGMQPPQGMEGMQPPQGMDGMPPFENMEEISKIMMESKGQITEEQKAKLKDLGVDENMFKMFEQMGRGNRGNFMLNGMELSWIGNIKATILVVISFVLALLGLFFVNRFKRKRYVVCKV